MSRRSVTTRRLDDITARLDELDWNVLETIALLRLVSGPQLQRAIHGPDDAAKQRRIRQMSRLSRLGLTLRFERPAGRPEGGAYPSVYALDVAGLRLMYPEMAKPRRPWAPSNPYVAHHLAVAEVYVGLVELTRQAGAEVEILSLATEPKCWRSWITTLGIPMTLKPDAHLVLGTEADEAHWWVEVDRGTESLPRILAKCRTYLDYWRTGIEEAARGVFPKVLWVVPTERRRNQLIKALQRLDAEDQILFAVSTDDQATSVLAGPGPEVAS